MMGRDGWRVRECDAAASHCMRHMSCMRQMREMASSPVRSSTPLYRSVRLGMVCYTERTKSTPTQGTNSF